MSESIQTNLSLDKTPEANCDTPATDSLSLDSDESQDRIIKIKAKKPQTQKKEIEEKEPEEKEPETYTISRKAVSLSTIIDVACQGDSEENELEFEISEEMMALIVEWLRHHNGVAPTPVKKPIRSKNIAEIVSDPWDAQFLLRLNKAKLYELTKAANFLDIKPLLDICAAKIASIIKGVPLEKAEAALDPNTPETVEEQKTN